MAHDGGEPTLLTPHETITALADRLGAHVTLFGQAPAARRKRPARVFRLVPRRAPTTTRLPRGRFRHRWRVVAATVPLVIAVAPVVGAGLERVGLQTAAAMARALPLAVVATMQETVGRTRLDTLQEIGTDHHTPLLRVSPPQGAQITGFVKNVPHGDVRLVAYLYVDPWVASLRGCHAAHWYGSKPVAGAVHAIGLTGRWSLTWQSEVSSTKICDRLASQIAVFVVPQDYTPPALLAETENETLPDELFRVAVAFTVVDRTAF